MQRCILDASFILTAAFDVHGKVAKTFEQLFQDHKKNQNTLYILHHTMLEIANGLRFSQDNEKLSKEMMQRVLALPLEIFKPSLMQMEKAIELSYATKTTVYDAIYHVVAIALDGIFYTCDKKYVLATKGMGNISLIEPKRTL